MFLNLLLSAALATTPSVSATEKNTRKALSIQL